MRWTRTAHAYQSSSAYTDQLNSVILSKTDFNSLRSPFLKHKMLPPLMLSPAVNGHNSIKRQNCLDEKRSQSHQNMSRVNQLKQAATIHQLPSSPANQNQPQYTQHPGSRFQVKRFVFPSLQNSDDSDESAKTHPGYSIA